MKIEKTREAAEAGGYDTIIVDPDAGGYRCYMPGEIVRPDPPPETAESRLAQHPELVALIDALEATLPLARGTLRASVAARL